MPNTYVLLHGAWHGAWCWRDVAAQLRAAGHQVTTPTQTGLGERRHLLSAHVTLDTFVEDVVQHLEAEEIEDAILVGHSFGGLGISGAADRAPGRIRHLVYLDSMIIKGGESPWSCLPPEVVAERRRVVEEQGAGLFAPPASRRLLRRAGGSPARPLGPLTADAAPGQHLPHPAAPAEPGRERAALHLYRLHRPLVWAARLGAGLGTWPARLELAGDRHRPRCHGDSARAPGGDA